MNERPVGKDSTARASVDPGEDMNVRHVHAAIWREEADPTEFMTRAPLLLRHFYFVMFIWMIVYLLTYGGNWRWDEYEARLADRGARERARATPVPATAKP